MTRALGMKALIEECQRLRAELRPLSDEHARLSLQERLCRSLIGAHDGETLEEAIVRVKNERNALNERLAAASGWSEAA